MIVAELAVLDVLLLVGIVLGWRMWRDVLAKIIDREKAMDLHAKAVTREAMRTTAEARRTIESAQNTLNEAQRGR